jgi:galactokinase
MSGTSRTNGQAGTGEPQWYPLPVPALAAARATAAFHEAYGRDPDGLWAAPGRVNVVGEHVDYQAGLCLPFALPQRTVVAVAARDDDLLRLRSVQCGGSGDGWKGRISEVRPGSVPGWAGYGAGVPWAMRADGLDVPGVDALVDGAVPLGAGLSSSAALECAMALALDAVAGLGLSATDTGRARLAAACVRAENEIAGAPTGGMDQASSLRCRAGHALLLDCRDFGVTHLPFDLAGAGLELLVVDTRAHHVLVDGQYGSRRDSCARACALLGVASLREVPPSDLDAALATLRAGGGEELCRYTRHVVTEIERVRAVAGLLGTHRPREIGPLLDSSHRSLRDDYRISCPELDTACEAALAAGALGARMTGGGFGGSAVALTDSAAVAGVASAVARAFAARGWDPPAFLHAVPSAGGERIG